MNARPVETASDRASMRPMRADDLEAVLEIELRAYPFPWTRGIFRDCLLADYPARVLVQDGAIIAYGMLSVAADEAHVLNVCAAPEVQGCGHGRRPSRRGPRPTGTPSSCEPWSGRPAPRT